MNFIEAGAAHEEATALALLDHLGPDAAAELIDRMGLLLSAVADELEDEGDRVYLGSTNHADRIREMAERWRGHRYEIAAEENSQCGRP